MEEYIESFILSKEIYCQSRNIAKIVCVEKECKSCAFRCDKADCQCIEKHKECKKSKQLQNLIDAVNRQRRIPSSENQASFKVIVDLYDKVIQQLSQEKAKFVDYTMLYGLSDNTRKLVAMLNEGAHAQISGVLTSKVSLQIQNTNFTDFAKPEEILKNWQDVKKKYQQFKWSLSKYQLNAKRVDLTIPSVILDPAGQGIIRKFLPKQVKQFKLLYRGSQQQFSAQKYHECCQGIANTLVVVHNQFDKVIGGFTPYKRNRSGSYISDIYKETFLFSVNLNKRFDCQNGQRAFHQRSLDSGPCFGDGQDLFIEDKCHEGANSGANIGMTYRDAQGKNNQQTITAFTGQKNGYHFRVKQYEVFEVFWA